MIKVSRKALVEFSAEQMYELVLDIDQYPLFLENCSAAKMISRTETECLGSLTLKKLGVSVEFSTQNQLIKNERISLNLASGPLQSLSGFWHFKALTEHDCQVEFELAFDVSNIAAFAVKNIIKQMADQMVATFCDRAKTVYNHKD